MHVSVVVVAALQSLPPALPPSLPPFHLFSLSGSTDPVVAAATPLPAVGRRGELGHLC